MSLTLQDVSHAVRETQYAVRGAIVARASELERQGRRIIYCNIGNPQSLGQRPLTFVRQVLSLAEYPALLESPPAGLFPEDAREAARLVLRESPHGLGAYTESRGFRFVRQAVADFVHERDGIPTDAEHVFLTDGASKGVQAVLRLLVDGPGDGVMIPIPQYPLYSASITLLGGSQVPYLLDEANDWRLSREALETAHAAAVAKGIRVRAIAVINPGNPTGAVLDEANVEMVLDFAHRHGLSILADEVYQENVYRTGDRFVSFASVLVRRGILDVPLWSFHSVSKGFLGECGHRGGYLECRNVPDDVMGEVEKLQSVALCANSVGQVVTWIMVRPPRPGDPSFPDLGPGAARGPRLAARAGRAARARPERHPRHPVQRAHRRDVRLPAHHAPAGHHRRAVLPRAPRGDGHLRGARVGLRPAPRDLALPHHHPPAPGRDRDRGAEARRVPRRVHEGAGRLTPFLAPGLSARPRLRPRRAGRPCRVPTAPRGGGRPRRG